MVNLLSIPGNIIRGTTSVVVQSAETLIDIAIPGVKRKDEHAAQNGQLNVYQMADPMLNLSISIYMISELRRCARREIKKLQEELNLDEKKMDAIINAIDAKVQILMDMEEGAGENGSNGKSSAGRCSRDDDDSIALKYRNSIQQIQKLAKRYNMSVSHMDSFEKFNDILRTPKTSAQYLSDLRVYGSLISKAFMVGFGGEDFQLGSLESLVQRNMGKTDAEIVHFDDEFDSFVRFGTECCYAIAVSTASRTITVVFRGSVRPQDFVTDLDFNSDELRLPGFTGKETGFDKDGKDTRAMFGMVHQGFNKFLFGKTKRGENERIISKAEVIMGKLNSLLAGKCKGYDVYFTGHSLGASLSTLMAFRAVALGEIPHVKNVSFASLFVGDQEFRNNFEELEIQGKIQHLRISNDEDIVPLIPWSTYDLKRYKHVGMNIRMYNPSLLTPRYRIFYPKQGDAINELRNAMHNNVLLGFTITFVPKHFCPEYRKRLDESKEELEKISLVQLYKDSEITGWKASS